LELINALCFYRNDLPPEKDAARRAFYRVLNEFAERRCMPPNGDFLPKARREPIFYSPESAAPAACGKSATGNRRATCGKLLKRDGELPFLTGGKHFDRGGNQLVKTKGSVFFRFP
jgi:hypothetical protein